VATFLRRRAPSLARFFEREVGARDLALLVAVTSTADAWAFLAPHGQRSGAACAALVLAAAELAVLTCALAVLLRLATLRRLGAAATPLAAATLTAYLALDRIAFGVIDAHPGLETASETWEAIRAGALTPSARGIAQGVVALLGLWLALAVALKAIAWLPPTPRAERLVKTAAVPALLAAATACTLRACVFRGAAGARAVARAIPWEAEEPAPAADPAGSRVAALFGEERVFALLQLRGAAILAGPVRARSRPDILVVHVESLRFDMLRPDVTPSMTALAKEGITPRHHLTTGTNTGTGVFGIVDGLLSPYYPLARRDHVQPLPLRILKALGYRASVYFASNFREYDGLYDLFFAGSADFVYDGPREPVHAADAAMVRAYVASLRAAAAEAAPRFDYIVLDSSHYDYSYPPSFERFTPAMTLDLGIRDGVIVREGINEELRPRAPFVRNRYQNSVLYADSLVGDIVAALRETGRLDRTIVVVTGDHGEEFWEHGAFGHGYGHLSPEQCEVPLVLRLPGGPATTRYRYTSHADIFPTIFDFIGLDVAGGAFMNGKSLLAYDPSLDVAVSGFGVTGNKVDPRLVVVGDGLAVHWVDQAPFAVTDVTTEDGSPVAAPPQPRVDDLVARALTAKGLR
jgi:arylsulfatase A-like enzyme